MREVNTVIFDYGNTLSSAPYFSVPHPEIPNWDSLIQSHVFKDSAVSEPWMAGEKALGDVAAIIAGHSGVEAVSVERYLCLGCESVPENPEVLAFARELKRHGVQTACVTANFDVFNEVIVPAHGYRELFGVIVNSCDHGTWDKPALWPLAFEALGVPGYESALLIEDSAREVAQFRELGGLAIQYAGDKQLRCELTNYEVANKCIHLPACGRR